MTFSDLDALIAETLGREYVWKDHALAAAMDGFSIVFEYYDQTDVLYLVGEIPGFDKAAMERCAPEVLRANLFGGKTGGYAAFGYDADEEAFVLWDRMTLAEMLEDPFLDRLDAFLEALETWPARLAELSRRRDQFVSERPHPGMMA